MEEFLFCTILLTNQILLSEIVRDLNRRHECRHLWKTSPNKGNGCQVDGAPRLSPTQERKPKANSPVSDKPQLSPSRYPRRGLEVTSKPSKPLAPIFLKNYAKKKKEGKNEETALLGQDTDDKKETPAEEPSTIGASRYPGRKRKQILDLGIVSDDATSFDEEPRKKKAKTKG